MSERDTWNEWSNHVLGQFEVLNSRLDRLESKILDKVDNVNERAIKTETKQAVMEETVRNLVARIDGVEKQADETHEGVTDVKVSLGRRVAWGAGGGATIIALVEGIKLLLGIGG